MFQGGGKAHALRKLSCKNSIVLGEPLYLKAFPHNTNVTNVCPLETCYVARRMAYPRRWGSRVGHDSSRHRLQPVTAIKPTQFPTQHIPPASPAMRTYGSLLFCFYSWTRLSFYQNNRGSKAPCVSGTRVSRISEPITTCPSNLYAA